MGTLVLLQRIQERKASVAVVGLGYVGLPLAMAAAAAGFDVTGFDTEPHRVESLTRGPAWGGGLPARFPPGAPRPGHRPLRVGGRAKDLGGARPRPPNLDEAFLPAFHRRGRAVLAPKARGDGEAAGEPLPPRQHRP